MHGYVYIFENQKAQRVKVGMTTDKVINRIWDLNDLWSQRKVTCQICGSRLMATKDGSLPVHILSGKPCSGGLTWPLEKDVSIAESYLLYLQNEREKSSGTDKGSLSKRIKSLEERIRKFKSYTRPVGSWSRRVEYFTEEPAKAEALSHEILAEYLDQNAPLGEVFACSLDDAIEAVETALKQLGLYSEARKVSH